MSENNLIPKTPIFLPNAQDRHLEKLGIHLPAILMDTRHVGWRAEVAEGLRKICDLFIIDPSTDILLFKDARGGENFKKLGYPKDLEIEKVYSDPVFRKEQVLQCAVQDQIQKKASLVIAPYFFSGDTDDTKFSVNISLLAETLRYLEETKQSLPVFAMIEIGSSVLNRPTVINYIVDRYKNDFRGLVKGYIVVMNDLDCERADQDSLLQFARLVFQLSEDALVLVNRIGPFGEVLAAIGAAGFGSGLAGGEMFSAKNLETSPRGWGKKVEKTYIPEIFDYLNDVGTKKVKYTCSCPFCKGSFPKDNESKKLHFVYTRMEAAKSMQGLTIEKRIGVVGRKIDEAIRLTSKWSAQAIDVKTAYLPRWKAVLDLAKSWEFPGEDIELKSLLSELGS